MKKFNEHTLKTLNSYGLETTKQMKNVLIRNNKRATGNLINSIDYDISIKKGNYNIDISYAGYGQFVAGRDRKGNPGNSPRWKRSGPPVEQIKRWLWSKNIPFKKELYPGKKRPNKKKQIDIMAFLIIRKIKQRGKLNPRFNNPTDFLKPRDKLLNSKRFNEDLKNSLIRDALEKISYDIKNNFKK